MNKVNHDLRCVDGGTLYTPPNASIVNLDRPSLHETSSTPLYDLGTKFVFNDKVYKYCKAGTGGWLRPQNGAGTNVAISVSYTTLSYPDATATTVAAAVGATSVYVVDAGTTKDEYKGGHVILGHNSNATTQNRGIIGNDAAATIAGVANVVKIDLDYPLHTALVAATSGIEVWQSPYADLQGSPGEHASVICVPCVYVATTAAEYFWGQTWGAIWMTGGIAGFGGAQEERALVFNGEGALVDALTEVGSARQHAGFVLEMTSGGDSTFMMLQISP